MDSDLLNFTDAFSSSHKKAHTYTQTCKLKHCNDRQFFSQFKKSS